MDRKQLTEFRQLLDARHDALWDEVREDIRHVDSERYQVIAGQVADAGDASLADLIVDLNLFDTERDLEELRDVEAALARLREGSYGRCSDCGEAIKIERLRAWPTARRCLDCQVLYEKTHARTAQTTR